MSLITIAGISNGGKIASFDLDWTLVRPYKSKVFKDEDDWKFLPNRLVSLDYLVKHSYTIAIFTNQNVKVDTAIPRIKNIVKTLNENNIFPFVFVSTKKDEYRKPNTGMWEELLKHIKDIDVDSSYYCGTEDDDIIFANNCGIHYNTPSEIFPDIPLEFPDPQTLLIFVGLGGRSEFFDTYLKDKGWFLANQDVLKTHATVLDVTKKALENKQSVAINSTNTKAEERKDYTKLAAEYQVPAMILYFIGRGITDNVYYKNLEEPSEDLDKIPVVELYDHYFVALDNTQKRIVEEKKEKVEADNFVNCSIDKGCEGLTQEDCAKSCTCFYLEPYGCLPRKIKDAELINEDPDKYIKTYLGKTEDLKKMVEIAAYLYYNYEGGGLTDNAFDALEYYLKQKEKLKGRLYEKIGAPPVDKIRTKLPYFMGSLPKIKPGSGEAVRFLAKFKNNKVCTWSNKLDGVSGLIVYKKGILHKIYTRGDGIIGGDITYVKDYIKNIPQTIKSDDEVVVRGEFIISKDLWNKYKDTYSVARAFVSGKLNNGFISQGLSDIVFVSYDIIKLNDEVFSTMTDKFNKLGSLGFEVVTHGSFVSPTIFQLIETYKKKREESIYYMDGLVITVDEISSIDYQTGNTYAFKVDLDEQKRKSKLTTIEWNISKYGKYIPVAIFESVYIDGARLHRATAHNAKHVQDWRLGKGTQVSVVRAGDVIPQMKDVIVDPNIEPIYPDMEKYKWHWEKSDIVLDEIDTNREVLIKRIVNFFETIQVPQLRDKTAEKMFESGFRLPEDIVRASAKDLQKIKGIGPKKSKFFYDKIRETMINTPPDRFIVASTTFQSGIGRKLLKQLFRYVPTILDLTTEEIKTTLTKKKIPGFGKVRIENTAVDIPKFRAYIDSFAKTDLEQAIKNYNEKIENLKKNGYNPMIKDKKFVFTGFMGFTDYELEDYIYDHQGDIVSSVTKDVEAVVSANVMIISDKMEEASTHGIPVLSIEEFAERYNIPLKRFIEKVDETEE